MKDFNAKECVGNIYFRRSSDGGFDTYYTIDKNFKTISADFLEDMSENYEGVIEGGWVGVDSPPSGVLHLLGVFFE